MKNLSVLLYYIVEGVIVLLTSILIIQDSIVWGLLEVFNMIIVLMVYIGLRIGLVALTGHGGPLIPLIRRNIKDRDDC